LHRCTLVRADEFQFGFLLLTSTLYFQLGSGSGLDVIKYHTCSNTCSLAVIKFYLLTKLTSQRLTQIFGLYQIIGGTFCIGISLYLLLFNFRINIFFVFYALLSLGLSTFCLIAGINCFKHLLVGLTLTFYNQLLQFVFFTIFGFTYMFNPGIGVFFGIDISDSLQLAYEFTLPYLHFGKSNPDKIVLLINFIPLIIAFLIDPIKKRIK